MPKILRFETDDKKSKPKGVFKKQIACSQGNKISIKLNLTSTGDIRQ